MKAGGDDGLGDVVDDLLVVLYHRGGGGHSRGQLLVILTIWVSVDGFA
jgi:hypothetical protein